MAGYKTRQRGAGMRKRLRKVGKWIISPKVGLSVSAIFGVWDLVDAIRYAVMGRTGPAVYSWVLVGLMVWCCQYWARRLREQNGGVLWIPKVKLERQFANIGRGSWLVSCGNTNVQVGGGPYYQSDPIMKPGHPNWEPALKLATEEVVEKYREWKLSRKSDGKTRKRIPKEGRRGHRGNAADDPSGAAEGAGGGSGGQPSAREGAVLASTGIFSVPGVASSGLSGLITGVTHLEFDTEPLDTTQPPEPDAELDTYTIPVWGFRSWNLLEGGVPKLGSLNSGRHVWTPGVNVAKCQAADFEMKTFSGQVAFSMHSSGPSPTHVPGDSCTCGFYAVRDVFDVQPGIIGGVVGWGKVVDGEKGWRAEKAAVAALFRSPWAGVKEQQKVEMLAAMYGVPVCLTLIDLADKTRKLAEWMAGDDLLEELPNG